MIVDIALNGRADEPSWWRLTALLLLWLFLFNLPLPSSVVGFFFGRFSIYEQQIVFALAFIMPAFCFCPLKASRVGELGRSAFRPF